MKTIRNTRFLQISGLLLAALVWSAQMSSPDNGNTGGNENGFNGPSEPVTAYISSGNGVACNGGNNGSVTVTATGGTPPYSYAWSHGPTTPTASNLSAGFYTVTVTGSSGSGTASVTAQIKQPTAITVTVNVNGIITCAQPSANVSAAVQGGVAPYTFMWPNGATTPQTTFSQTGAYTVIVTDNNGCTKTATALVEQNTVLPIAAIAPPGTLNCNNTSIQLNASASSQGGEFTYLWTSQNGNIITGAQTLTPIVNQAGTYRLIISNITNACTAEAGVTVIQRTPVTAVATATPVSCFGGANGSASVQGSGGAGIYTYLWSNGNTSAVANNLTAGSYTPTVTDSEGCSATATAVVAQPPTLQLSATATAETALNLEDGTATASATGGIPGYTYAWSNGGNTALISGLSPGSYTVTATDANGCTAVQIVNVNSFNCALQTEMIASPVKCFGTAGGVANALVTGGSGDVMYLWSNGATTDTAEDLPGGIIYVTATDGLGCSVVDSVEITSPAGPLLASVTNINPVYCPLDQNGSATPVTSGGWGLPYSFQFSWGLGGFNNLPVGDYSYTVTDMEGCSVVANFEIASSDSVAPVVVCPENYVLCGADLLEYSFPVVSDDCAGGDTEATLLSGQPSGSAFLDGVTTQLFSATDASGNTATCSFTVTVFPVSDVIINSITNDMNSAGTGSIDIEPVGDSGPYIFEWKKDGVFFADSEDLSGLSMGTYTLIVTDANGCTVQLSPIEIDNLTGTGDLSSAGSSIKLWPNPAHHTFRVEMTNLVPVAMEILHAQGQLVRVLESSEWNSDISVSGLPAGFYLLKIVSRNGNCHVIKWVKTAQ